MMSVKKAIFPGIVAGCLFLVLATSLIASPRRAQASNISSSAVGAGEDLSSADAPSSALASVLQDAALQGSAQGTGAGAGTPPLSAAPEEPAAPEGPAAADMPREELAEPAPACSLNPAYPQSVLQWCDWIDTYAAENALDPNLIAAVMVQESGGDPNAYSRNGAVGLMQVMPRDGLAAGFQCINGPCFASRPSTNELYDPEFNIAYGARMLAGLIQKKGDVREALKSYGPMNIGYHYADLVLGIMSQYR